MFNNLNMLGPAPVLIIKNHSQRAWLKGDLTNHNAKFTILPDKQIREESRWLTSVDSNLINSVYWCLSVVEIKYIMMFIHVYLVL